MQKHFSKADLSFHSNKRKSSFKSNSITHEISAKNKHVAVNNQNRTGLRIPDVISRITINVNGVSYHVKNCHKDNNTEFMKSVSEILGK